ncbi:DUF5808 domain-containing protein [Xanthomarina gelatinilytica]|uniref:DUF5808 domain-containing protein n=1 Tax=Xanthomarina gelatinilytica TaxID=1137281 RepID=UPI003AA9D92A
MSSNKERHNQWHKDPSNWKFGVFYYNKKDDRLFPPKRFKATGWTINFVNPKSILLFLGLVALVILISKGI